MKKALSTPLVVLFSLCSIASSAQIKKGVWLLGGGASASTTLSDMRDDFSFSITPSGGYFITDQWLIGTGLGYRPWFLSFEDQEYTFQSFSITPFARYYFNRPEQSFHWFATLGSTFIRFRTTSNQPVISETERSSIEPFAGAGFNFFANSNIALEGTLLYRGYFEENFDSHSIIYNVGLQFFLLPHANTASTENNAIALSKGAWLLGISGNGGWFGIGEFDDLYASFSPAAGYFLTNRLALGAGFQLAFANQNAIVYPEPFARYYIGGSSSRIQPFATAGFGTRFQLADKTNDPGFFNLNLTAGIGLDYFLTPNLALEALLKYDGRQLEDDFINEFLDFGVGFQFFLR